MAARDNEERCRRKGEKMHYYFSFDIQNRTMHTRTLPSVEDNTDNEGTELQFES